MEMLWKLTPISIDIYWYIWYSLTIFTARHRSPLKCQFLPYHGKSWRVDINIMFPEDFLIDSRWASMLASAGFTLCHWAFSICKHYLYTTPLLFIAPAYCRCRQHFWIEELLEVFIDRDICCTGNGIIAINTAAPIPYNFGSARRWHWWLGHFDWFR